MGKQSTTNSAGAPSAVRLRHCRFCIFSKYRVPVAEVPLPAILPLHSLPSSLSSATASEFKDIRTMVSDSSTSGGASVANSPRRGRPLSSDRRRREAATTPGSRFCGCGSFGPRGSALARPHPAPNRPGRRYSAGSSRLSANQTTWGSPALLPLRCVAVAQATRFRCHSREHGHESRSSVWPASAATGGNGDGESVGGGRI